jgi:type VI secretion system protein ImpJ
MLTHEKVIWKEGLFLQPQHFQQSERHLLNAMQRRFTAYHQHYAGFLQYDISSEALLNNTFHLAVAQGVLPDGTFFSFPEEALAPSARSITEHLSHDQLFVDVYVALPLTQSGRPSVADKSGPSHAARFSSEVRSVPDEVFGQQSKDIEVGRSNFCILFSDESRDNYSCLQIARLMRTENGQPGLDGSFIPPLLRIGASSALSAQLRSMLEMLIAKSHTLSQGRKHLKGGLAEFAAHETTPQLLLHTVNSYTALLNHALSDLTAHPYELYLTLLQFCGSLITFSADTGITQLPYSYEHFRPADTFKRFDSILKSILGASVSTGSILLALEQINPSTFYSRITDNKLFETASFFLGVKADVPEKELIFGSVQRIKMSSRNQLDTLIQSAMPGLPLMHTPTPPPNLSSKPGYVYFNLNQKNLFWEAIRTTGELALYFPNNYANLSMELIAVVA